MASALIFFLAAQAQCHNEARVSVFAGFVKEDLTTKGGPSCGNKAVDKSRTDCGCAMDRPRDASPNSRQGAFDNGLL